MAKGSARGARDSATLVFDRKVRPAIEALKFVENYREQWQRVVGVHGLRAVRAATRTMRGRPRRLPDTPVLRDVQDLLRWVPMPLAAPVDPDDPKDDGGGLVRRRPVLTSVTPTDGDRLRELARFAARLGRVPRVTRESPWVLVEVNLASPIETLASELRVLRKSLGIGHVRRLASRRAWGALEPAFAMRRALDANPRVRHLELARRFLEWDPDDAGGRMPHDVARSVRSLLASANWHIDEMSNWVEDGCPSASGPFLFADGEEN